jgi:hypothetical protein
MQAVDEKVEKENRRLDTQSILRGEPILREVRNQCSCLQTCSERTGQLVPPQHIGWSISCRTITFFKSVLVLENRIHIFPHVID